MGYTPAPWTVTHHRDDENSDFYTINAALRKSQAESAANARLIAEAPILLKELENSAKTLEQVMLRIRRSDFQDNLYQEVMIARNTAYKAIDKATK